MSDRIRVKFVQPNIQGEVDAEDVERVVLGVLKRVAALVEKESASAARNTYAEHPGIAGRYKCVELMAALVGDLSAVPANSPTGPCKSEPTIGRVWLDDKLRDATIPVNIEEFGWEQKFKALREDARALVSLTECLLPLIGIPSPAGALRDTIENVRAHL